MRKFKKQLTLALAVAMTLAMGITASAAPSPAASVQEAIVLAKEAIVVPEGSTVVVKNITAVAADSPARTTLVDQVKSLESTGLAVEKVILMDLEADGSGEVEFKVGSEYAGKKVYARHFNGTSWDDIGSAVVNADGSVTFTFASFSPVALVVATEAAAADSAVSPKTGENMTILAVQFLAMASIATLFVAGKRAKRTN